MDVLLYCNHDGYLVSQARNFVRPDTLVTTRLCRVAGLEEMLE